MNYKGYEVIYTPSQTPNWRVDNLRIPVVWSGHSRYFKKITPKQGFYCLFITSFHY